MRIISGRLKGRKINPPHLVATRPTTDFAKTALFNILNNNFDFEAISFLDLFAGTGNHSYEFASRGCTRIVSVDKDGVCIDFMKRMKEEWNLEGMEPTRKDVLQFIDNCREKFDIIFAGPPYAMEEINELPDRIFNHNLVKDDGWFILETSPAHKFDSHPYLFRVKNYGQTHFHFFSLQAEQLRDSRK